MAKILITGANGQLGSEFATISTNSQHSFTLTDVNELDISNAEAIDKFLKQSTSDYIINCAAYTAVDKAESQQALATKINSKAPEYLAVAANKHKCKLIHVSTDYVFDGSNSTPYTEDQDTQPTGIYGSSKLAGEQAIAKQGGQYIILRTSWLYSVYGNNFVKTMLRLGQERDSLNVVGDQIGSPTLASDLALAIMHIIQQTENSETAFATGIYHYSNEGVASWYDFAEAIMQTAGNDCKVSSIPSDQYPTPTKRPAYSVMSKEKIKTTFGLHIPHWQQSLSSCIAKLLVPLK